MVEGTVVGAFEGEVGDEVVRVVFEEDLLAVVQVLDQVVRICAVGSVVVEGVGVDVVLLLVSHYSLFYC